MTSGAVPEVTSPKPLISSKLEVSRVDTGHTYSCLISLMLAIITVSSGSFHHSDRILAICVNGSDIPISFLPSVPLPLRQRFSIQACGIVSSMRFVSTRSKWLSLTMFINKLFVVAGYVYYCHSLMYLFYLYSLYFYVLNLCVTMSDWHIKCILIGWLIGRLVVTRMN